MDGKGTFEIMVFCKAILNDGKELIIVRAGVRDLRATKQKDTSKFKMRITKKFKIKPIFKVLASDLKPIGISTSRWKKYIRPLVITFVAVVGLVIFSYVVLF